MQVTRATFIPLLAAANSDRIDPGAVRDEYTADLTVVYTFGPQFGRRVVTQADLEQLEIAPRVLRRSAFEHLEVLSSRAEFHGQPPALMLSFEGLESSLLLANDFWNRLQGAVPGEVVVGVPARDVVIVTGSQSAPGLEKARRCVERVFMAGGENPLTQGLLVRRGGTWEPYDRPARQGSRTSIGPASQLGPAHQLGQGQPPRQYQEHPSWPESRVQPVPQRRSAPPAGARPGAAPLAPAALLQGRPVVTLPPVPGNLGPAGPAMSGQGPVPPVPMSSNTSTGMQPVPRQRPAHGQRAQQTPDVAPYSAVPYSAMPYSSVPYSAVPQSPVPQSAVPQSAAPRSVPQSSTPRQGRSQSGGPRSAAPHSHPQHSHPQHSVPQHSVPQHSAPQQSVPQSAQAAMQYSAVPYSAVPYSAVPQSAVPHSAVPYSAAPYNGAQSGAGAYARPAARPVSHREQDSRDARSRGPQPRHTEDNKPAYRDDSRRDERPRDGWARDDRGRDARAHEDRVRDDRGRDDRGYAERPRDDRYRDDLYSTGTHAGPLYPPTPSASRGDGYDYQQDTPQPNYPDSWGWVPDASAPRPQQQRPLSPRDRFSR